MGMTPASIAGQVPNSDNVRRNPSNRVAGPSRKTSAASTTMARDSGLNKRALDGTIGRKPITPVSFTGKKLPWLDGSDRRTLRHVPCSFSSDKSIRLGDKPPASEGKKDTPRAAASANRPVPTDLILRTVGSTPSLRQRARTPDTRKWSVTSSPRPGMRPALSKDSIPHVLDIAREKTVRDGDYTPSEYSTTPSTERDNLPAGMPKKDAASYENLVAKANSETSSSSHGFHPWNKTLLNEIHVPRRRSDLPHSDPFAHYDPYLDAITHTGPSRTEPDAGNRDDSRFSEKGSHGVTFTSWKRQGTGPATEGETIGTYEPTHEEATVSEPRVRAGRTSATGNDPRARGIPKAMPRTLRSAGKSEGLSSPGSNVRAIDPAFSSSSQGLSPFQHLRRGSKAPRPPGRPIDRTPTLQLMPTHLFPASSSSSPDLSPAPQSLRPRILKPKVGQFARTPTLQVMPSHLQTASSSSSQDLSPMARKPMRQSFEDTPTTSLARAVTGLEDLMQEALTVARDAADQDRSEDVAQILNEATTALRRASTVHGVMAEPLAVSESGFSSDTSDSESDMSSLHSRQASVETEPTILTRSAQSSRQPVIVAPYKRDGGLPAPQAAVIEMSGHRLSSPDDSISHTPPRLYHPQSADSIAIDWAYAKKKPTRRAHTDSSSESNRIVPIFLRDLENPATVRALTHESINRVTRSGPTTHDKAADGRERANRFSDEREPRKLRRLEPVPTDTIPVRVSSRSRSYDRLPDEKPRWRKGHKPLTESSFYHVPESNRESKRSRYEEPTEPDRQGNRSKRDRYSEAPIPITQGYSLKHPRRHHISLREHQPFSLGRHHKRQPIAREWNTTRKRITAMIACINTAFVGLIAGIYAGEVPRIQYQIADTKHQVILGNVLLYIGIGLTTILFWPLPLLHGRKPYTLLAFAITLPLQFPQALSIQTYRDPTTPTYRIGLLLPRAISGLALGFANINLITTLFDLFGVSLQSSHPHEELVINDDVRRQGGGVGLWLGIWVWCYVGSLSVGFSIGAGIIAHLDPSWGFYLIVILLAVSLLVNVLAPETRRSAYRRSIAHYMDEEEKVKRRVARGEVKLHIETEGPKWWFEEVVAGWRLMKRMAFQPGFFVLTLYLAWTYAQVVLVILLLGTLLSRDYRWRPQYIAVSVLALAFGALLAVPLTKANLFSRSRVNPARTDSMTFKPRVTWSSHLVRRCIFTLTLPFAGLAYTLSSPGPSVSWVVPTIMAALVGFLSSLAIAECIGLIMETFDTSDLQPGVNSKHRLQSMATTTRRRRTNYSSFPRVCAGFFAAQGLGYFLAAAATGVSGDVTRALGAQISTAVVAAILLILTALLLIVLWRWKTVQVIPIHAFGTKRSSVDWGAANVDEYWKPVIIGNPSGKVRRMNMLELGSWSRWTEIRKLNNLIRD